MVVRKKATKKKRLSRRQVLEFSIKDQRQVAVALLDLLLEKLPPSLFQKTLIDGVRAEKKGNSFISSMNEDNDPTGKKLYDSTITELGRVGITEQEIKDFMINHESSVVKRFAILAGGENPAVGLTDGNTEFVHLVQRIIEEKKVVV